MLTHRGVFSILASSVYSVSDIAVYVRGAPEPALWHAVTAIARDRRAVDIRKNIAPHPVLRVHLLLLRAGVVLLTHVDNFERIDFPVGVNSTLPSIRRGFCTKLGG